jgi:hypothetical protein
MRKQENRDNQRRAIRRLTSIERQLHLRRRRASRLADPKDRLVKTGAGGIRKHAGLIATLVLVLTTVWAARKADAIGPRRRRRSGPPTTPFIISRFVPPLCESKQPVVRFLQPPLERGEVKHGLADDHAWLERALHRALRHVVRVHLQFQSEHIE